MNERHGRAYVMFLVARIITLILSIIVIKDAKLYAATSQFRTPLTFVEERGAVHYPLKSIQDTWWMKVMDNNIDTVDRVNSTQDTDYNQKAWCFTSIKGVYGRSATKSFFDACDTPCKNKLTRDTVSLSTLWFGKESFRGEEVFPGGIFTNYCDNNALKINDNIALGFSRITPRFRLNSWLLLTGITLHYRHRN